MPLTDSRCRSAEPGKHADGGGLYLNVTPGGTRAWRLAYRFGGRQKTLAFGRYPGVSLAAARLQRQGAKAKLDAGIDPAAPPEAGRPFREIAEEWLNARSDRWKASHLERVRRRLELNVYPALGDRAIGDIGPKDVLDAVRAVEGRGALHIARRTNQAISAIFRYGVAAGEAPVNPAADLRGALKVLPRVRHRASLTPDQIPDFMGKLSAYDGDPVTRLAIELTLRTMLRTNEVRFGLWSEIEGDLWRIPADRMKEWGLPHLVPIVPQIRRVLDELGQYSQSKDYIVSINGGPISENTMLYGVYRIGYHSRLTVHGLRGTASTYLNESGRFHEDWIERQLAHFPRDAVRAAYNAAEYLPQRREMLQWWNDELDRMKEPPGA